jgi:hypothetical protein
MALCFSALGLEHFQAKWEPVRRPEMRQNKKIERFHDSTQHESALVTRASARFPQTRSYGKRSPGTQEFGGGELEGFDKDAARSCRVRPIPPSRRHSAGS